MDKIIYMKEKEIFKSTVAFNIIILYRLINYEFTGTQTKPFAHF